MKRRLIAACLIAASAFPAMADDDDDTGGKTPKMKFWNLTGVDLVEVVLAPAGSDTFGADQTANDDNDSIENDERLPLKDVTAGQYDVRVKDKDGRVCLVKNVDVRDSGPYSFSLEADQLTDCKS